MGNRRSCIAQSSKTGAQVGSIVPDQDPLLRSASTRVQKSEISRDFELLPQVLGTGYSGAVRLATHITTRQQVAVKQFSKRRLKAHRLELLQSEVEVYLQLDHPNICRLLHAYESKNDVWLVMELCGCELYQRLCERKVYREIDAAFVMLQMLQAVNYLHTHRIVHRDLKLENWMYGANPRPAATPPAQQPSSSSAATQQPAERDDRLKLIDFGFSRILGGDDETLDMPCGTLHYTSPEVLSRKYTSKCDMWSLGVICYMLLVGRPPFRGANNLKIAKAIIQDDFPKDGRWAALKGDAHSFVTLLLQKDANKRPDAANALSHRWITDAQNLATFEGGGEIGLDVLMNLQKFARGSHLRRAALTMLAYSLTSRELQDLEETFLAFDKTGSGTITEQQLAEVMQGQMEVSSQEVARIFQSLDFSNDEELHYTPFIAAMLATRVKLHEDKVRAAFESFDRDGSGFITADSLVQIFHGLSGPAAGPGSMQGRGLSKEEADRWIREVDYKGNGVIDYDGFLNALMGKKLWAMPSLDSEEEQQPTVQVFDTEGPAARPRAMSDSFAAQLERQQIPRASLSRATAFNIAGMIIDGDAEEKRSQSFMPGCTNMTKEQKVVVRTVAIDVDDRHFA